MLGLPATVCPDASVIIKCRGGTIFNVVVKGEIVDHLQSKIGLSPIGIKHELNALYSPFNSVANTALRINNHSINSVIKKLQR